MTNLYRVLRDGGIMTDPMTHDDCWKWLHKHQGMSVDWAMAHEGWSIELVPECEKLNIWSNEYNALSEFVEWLQDQGIQFAANQLVTDDWDNEVTKFMPMRERSEDMIYRFLDIDPKKLETERRELLENLGNKM